MRDQSIVGSRRGFGFAVPMLIVFLWSVRRALHVWETGLLAPASSRAAVALILAELVAVALIAYGSGPWS